LIRHLDFTMLGGGTVEDVERDTFRLISDEHELNAVLETGLQNWAGIIGLKAAVEWLNRIKPGGLSRHAFEANLSEQLFTGLRSMPKVTLINHVASPTVSFFADGIDAHRLALYLGEQNIMCRSGSFCCHYYLIHLKKYPPLLRVALGLHNTSMDIDRFLTVLGTILKTF
ncbi:MAG: aminotransferase class V-fold PLP-dependent enzyme, partial [Candidatus Peregrinibacteria bacterium]